MFAATDAPEKGTFEAIYRALDEDSRERIGPADPRLLVIPIRDAAGVVTGGLWGTTLLGWFRLEMLVVPRKLRGQGIGAAMMAQAEAEARQRGCRGIQLDAFSFQAAGFYEKLGFTVCGVLEDCPPGHRRLFFEKRLT